MLKGFRYRLAVFFAVLGPGFITAMVDNDAGGIIVYSQAGARWGYLPLWTLIPITVVLIMTQEMCSRMGAVTGKGLSDLIREEFGLRVTFVVMALLVIVNLSNIMANFAGIAGSLELFHISRYVSVPAGAIVVWLLVNRGTYESVEKIFLFACIVYVAYIISGILVEPNWKAAAIYSVRPVLMLDSAYIYMLIAMVGTTIAPWMQFYLQSAVVEKGVTAKDYAESRLEVIVGCIGTNVIAFFIIVACAGAIYKFGPKDISTAEEAAQGLKPFGQYTFLLFSAGLFNASLFAACVQPLSTAYSVCEGLGFESGVNKRFREAPIFYWLYTLLIVVGAGVVLIPKFPLIRMILFSQVLNGVLLPIVLIFMVLLVNKKDLMKNWVNPRVYNLVVWVTVVVMIGMTLAYTRHQLARSLNGENESMIDEQKFKKLADDALNSLNRDLIAASDDYGFEVDFNSGALGVEFEDPPAKFVISPNTPVRQIWVSANNKSYKLDWDIVENTFVHAESGDSLKTLVEKAISKQMGEEISL